MSKRQPTSDLRGVILPEAAILDATITATSQAGPRAGVVIPDQVTGLALHGSGEIDAASEASTTTIEIATARGGNVGDATIRWRFSGDTLRSWDSPCALAGWEFLARSTTADRYRAPHAIRRASTGLVCVAVTYDSNTVQVYRQDAFGKWQSATVENTGATTRATLVDLPSGRLVCIYTVSVGASSTQIRSAYSDDGGATWTTGTSACLATAFAGASSTIKRVRAAELGGQVSLFMWSQVSADELYQYVSADGGNLFTAVETVSTSTTAYPDLAVLRGALYLVTLQYDAAYTPSTIRAQSRRLASASQPASSASTSDIGTSAVWGTYSAGAFTAGDLTVAGTDDGFLWVYGVDFDGSGTRAGIIRASPDGTTWYDNHSNSHGGVSGTLIAWNGDSTTCLRELSACAERGRVFLAHTPQTSPGGVATNFTSLCAGYMGGWSTVGMADPLNGEWWEQAGWDYAYLPIDLPTDTGTLWTRTLTGTATEVLGSTGITLTGAGLDRIYYTASPTISSGVAEGILAEWQLTVSTGTLTHDLRLTDGTNGYWIQALCSTTQIEIRDLNTGGTGTVLHTLTIDTTQGVVLRIALDNTAATWTGATGRVRAWARIDGPYAGASPILHGPRQDREWTHIGVTSTLTSAALANNRVRWGAISAGTGTYRWVLYSTGTQTAGNLAESVNGDVHGALVPPTSSPMHLTDGVRIAGVNGPTTSGDTYTMQPSYEYPISAVNPQLSPSPRRMWRSTGDALAQDIVLSGLDLGARAGDSWAVYVAGANWQTATLFRDSTGTNKILDLDLSAGLINLGFSRTRDLVYPTAAGSAGSAIYFGEGALAGSYLDLGGGVIRKISTNLSGAWTQSGTASYASTRITIDSYSGGDPTNGGTAKIRMSRGLWILDTMVSTDTLMLRIPAQDTAENYFTIGTLLIGRVRWFGRQYSRGRSLTFSPAYELAETRSGARRVRRLGPTRRAMEIAWDDGVDTTGLHSLPTTEPDYWTLGYTGADAVTDLAGTGRTLAGVIASTAGAYLPVVLAPSVPQQASSPGTAGIPILDPERHLYGRIVTETLRVDSDAAVRGDEFRDPGEMIKIGSVRVEEEV